MKYAKARYLLLIIFLVLSPLIRIEAQTELSAREIARKSLPSVVYIMCDDGKNIVYASGFLIRPGILVTNYHVIEGMSRGIVQVAFGVKQEKLNLRIARIIAFDKEADLALLSIPAAKEAGVPSMTLAPESYGVEVGEPVYALGNPEGLVGTMSPGIVSAGLRSTQKKTRIQITAPISHGSSGGPVVNGTGEVIGVAVSYLSEGQNLNFAVPVSLIYAIVRNAQFPDERQNSLDTAADGNRTLPSPWAVPLRIGSGGTDSGNSPVVNDTPISAVDYFYRGNSNSEKGRYAEAIADYTKAIQINPQDASAYYNRGNAYDNQGKYDLAIADFTKAIQLNPQLYEAYNDRGVDYSEQGKYDLAIADYTKAIRIDVQRASAYYNRGNAYERQGKHDLAIADYTKAIQIDPQNASAYGNRGIAYKHQGKHDLAIADYTKAIQIDPQHASAYNNRGNAYNDQGKHDLAIADCTKAIQIDPQDAPAYINRGVAYSKQGKHDLAIADYTKAIQINPQDADAYNNRGNAYYEQGKYDLAIADYTKVIQINPQDAHAYVIRGFAYCSSGQKNLANSDKRKAVKLGATGVTECQ